MRPAAPKYDFAKILEKTQNVLASQAAREAPLRSFAQLGVAMRKLAGGKPEMSAEINAQYYFSSKSLDLARHASSLRGMTLSQSLDAMEPVDELDVDRFLEHQHEMLVSSAVEECSRLSALSYRQALLGQIEDDWDLTKRDILDAMNYHASSGGQGAAVVGARKPVAWGSLASVAGGGEGAAGGAAGGLRPRTMGGAAGAGSAGAAAGDEWRDVAVPAGAAAVGGLSTSQRAYAEAVQDLNIEAARAVGLGSLDDADSAPGVASMQAKRAEGAAVGAMSLPAWVSVRVFREAAAAVAADADQASADLAAGRGEAMPDPSAHDALDCWDVLGELIQADVAAEDALVANQSDTGGSATSGAAAAAAAALGGDGYEAAPRQGAVADDLSRRRALVQGSLRFLELTFLHFIRDAARDADAALASMATGLAADSGDDDGGVAAGSAATSVLIDAYLASDDFRGRFTASSAAGAAAGGAQSAAAGYVAGSAVYEGAAADPVRRVCGNLSWARMYYCMRCGDVAAALLALRTAAARDGLRASALIAALDRRHKGLDPGSGWQALHDEFNLQTQQSADPFRTAVYSVVGRFRVEPAVQRNSLNRYVTLNIEDYLWSKLSAAWLSAAPLPAWLYPLDQQAGFTLEHLQSETLRLGEKHFNADGSAPLLYPRVLLLTLQFERALQAMLRYDTVLAVHVAMVLFAGRLITCSAPDAEMLSQRSAAPAAANAAAAASAPAAGGGLAVNVTRMLLRYAEGFAASSPLASVHYLLALAPLPPSPHALASAVADQAPGLGAGEAAALLSGASVPLAIRPDITAVVDLLVASKAFNALVATTRSFMSPHPVQRGPVLALYPRPHAQAILVAAAERLVAVADYNAAIRLYTLAGQPEQVGSLLLHMLSRVAAVPSAADERQRLLQWAGQFLIEESRSGRASGLGDAIVGPAVASLQVLHDICQFFVLYEKGPAAYEQALQYIDPLRLLPGSPQQDGPAGGALSVDDAGAATKAVLDGLDPLLKRLYGPLALAAMTIFHQQYRLALDARAPPAAVQAVRARARALVLFVAGNQLDGVGKDVQSRLLRISTQLD